MLVLVVDIMWKSLLFYKLDLLCNDNLTKCDTSLKNKIKFYLMVLLIIYTINIIILIFL